MDNIVNGVGQFATYISLFISSILGHPHTTTHLNPKPTVAVQQTDTGPSYNIYKSLSYMGYSVNMSASIPENGGTITGSISGNCTGPITGHYEGNKSGAINGQSNIKCNVTFIQVPGAVSFTGTVNKSAKNAQLQLVFHVGSINRTQNVVVNFN